jgi:DNA helicase-2/ATP-dependent DNA helicase PcrA
MSLNRERLEKRFFEEYERLNEKQRIAVDTIEGPVMVIAGPGTGKTQILASRIGRILLDTDAYPQNILCLTYTEAGVVAMRKRLVQFIGPDAYKVSIYTFHAFCNDVIQDNLSLFEKTVLDPVSELEKIQLFKELIDSFPKNHPLKRYRGDVYFEATNLESLFSTMKKEGWTPSFIKERIDHYLAGLTDREEYIYKRRYKEFNAGDLKQDRLDEEKERMEKLRAAVNEFDRFQQLMRKHNRYDFDDMINWVITAFNENKNLLAFYQEKYQHILVDEYQDTSGTQNLLVELLISYWEKPNVFVVGDDDQSIYRFQGANVENMLQFANSYKDDLLTVVLTHNYRSTQPILDISKALIDRNEERLVTKLPGLSKVLITGKLALQQIKHPPRVKEFETRRQEMIGIVQQVRQWLHEGTAPGRIAIIYKENKYGEELARYFKQLNIPVYSKRNLNLLELPFVQKILSLLRWIASEHDIPYSGDELLFEILHFDWFDIPAIEVAKLSMEVAEKKFSGNQSSIRQLMCEKSAAIQKDLFTPSIHHKLQMACSILEELVRDVPNLTLQQLFEKIIRKTGILSNAMQSSDKHWQFQLISAFFDFIREESHRNPQLGIQGLVELADMMQKEKITLPLVQVSGSEKGINLLTAHGSKGLEFEYVWLAGCNSSFWEKKRKPGGGYKMPDNIYSNKVEGSDEEELRRLFYVAVTRAEQHLYISFSRFTNEAKELEPSMFIAEIQDSYELPIEKVEIENEVLSEYTSLHFAEAMAPEIEKVEEDIIGRVLDRFVMNVTALNNFLHCPLEFYFRNLVRIPSPKNEATEFGSAIHHALEKLFRKMIDGGKEQFPGKEEFIADFEWYMQRHRESFTREQFARRMEYGRDVLSEYYEKYTAGFNKIVAIERNIRSVAGHVPIRGKLDKLEFNGQSVNVVDYKTGDPDKGIFKTKGPSEKDPNGGDYWRQAVFYKILVDNYDQKNWKVESTEFDFVEPDRKKNYRRQKVMIGPSDITTVTQQIIDTWQKIQDRQFYVGCGKDDCHWCNFVKTNELAVALHEAEPAGQEED